MNNIDNHDLNFLDKPLVATRKLIDSLVRSIVSDYEDSNTMFAVRPKFHLQKVAEPSGEEYGRWRREEEELLIEEEFGLEKEQFSLEEEDFLLEEDNAEYLEETEHPSLFHKSFHDEAKRICEPSACPPSAGGGSIGGFDEDELLLQRKRNELMNSITQLVLKYYRDCHEMPSPEDIANGLKGKLVIKDDGDEPSTLVVNSRLQIVLPDYNEMVVKMSPVTKTIYILFLRHPEGIVLKELADFRSEIEDIYCLVQPGRTISLMNETIDNLLDVTSGRIVQIISRIKHVFCSLILDQSLASKYIVAGKRGERFSIALRTDKIVLPKILQS